MVEWFLVWPKGLNKFHEWNYDKNIAHIKLFCKWKWKMLVCDVKVIDICFWQNETKKKNPTYLLSFGIPHFSSNFGLYLTHLSMFSSKILTFMFNLKVLTSWTMFSHIQLPKFLAMPSNCDEFNSSHNKRTRRIYLHLVL